MIGARRATSTTSSTVDVRHRARLASSARTQTWASNRIMGAARGGRRSTPEQWYLPTAALNLEVTQEVCAGMFSTFTIGDGRSLIIRTENLQRIEDTADGCKVSWVGAGEPLRCQVQGTAQDNYARLQSEELRLIEAAAQRQQRYNAALPLTPIPRGRTR